MSVMDESGELGRAAKEAVVSAAVQPRRRLGLSNSCVVAAVRPLRRVLADPRFNRVPDYVEDRRNQIGVAVNLCRKRSVLEEMRLASVPAICSARVVAVQHLEPR